MKTKICAAPSPHSFSSLPPLPPNPIAWSTQKPDVHVLSLFSNGTCGTAACWLRHMHHMVASDDRADYTMHVSFFDQHVERGATTGGRFQSPAWLRASRARIDALLRLLQRGARQSNLANRLYLLSDLDVLPLRRYSSVVQHFTELERRHGTIDILFMREPPGSCGMTAWVANTGFMLMRNTRRVRDFWRWTAGTSRGKMFDQDIANFLLVKKLKPGEVRWGLFPSAMVNANASAVAAETAAFHAVGVSGPAKFDALETAWRRHPRHELPGVHGAGSSVFGCAFDTSTVSVPPSWRAAPPFAPPPMLMCAS